MNQETLEKQYDIVEKETKTSHVMQWGEISLSKMKVSAFVGSGSGAPSTYGPFEDLNDPCLVSGPSEEWIRGLCFSVGGEGREGRRGGGGGWWCKYQSFVA